MATDEYAAGKRDGELEALRGVLSIHDSRIEKVETKISTLERVAYTLLGAVALVQFAPEFKEFLQ